MNTERIRQAFEAAMRQAERAQAAREECDKLRARIAELSDELDRMRNNQHRCSQMPAREEMFAVGVELEPGDRDCWLTTTTNAIRINNCPWCGERLV